MESSRLAEAEVEFKLLIKLLREVPEMDHASPMNAGIMRKLTEVLGQQGKFDEAYALNDEVYRAIEELSLSRFAKYEKSERSLTTRARRRMEKWNAELRNKGKARFKPHPEALQRL